MGKHNLQRRPGGLGKPAKRAKLSSKGSPIREDLLSEDSVKSLKDQHENSGPYRHVVIDSLCSPDRMRAVHDEAIHTMKTTYKETDLFKVYQTGDLMALDVDPKNAEKVPELLALRASLYSPEFREFVGKITGVTDLTDRCDCSGNAYTQGCHLLCHDDVIGTRRVSYIIYMTDPDDPWVEEDGGSLELYPLDPKNIKTTDVVDGSYMSSIDQGIPANVPTAKIIPAFNRMALFTVQPGRSYHSVQEVYNKVGKVRLSISGWYHGPCPPLGADQASLAQVMSAGSEPTQYKLFPTLTEKFYEDLRMQQVSSMMSLHSGSGSQKSEMQSPVEGTLSESDRLYLQKYMNPAYLDASQMNQIRERFIEESAVQLSDFICSENASVIATASAEADQKDGIGMERTPKSYEVGQSDHWGICGPPHKQLFMTKKGNKSGGESTEPCDAVALKLEQYQKELFESESFARYLTCITTLKPLGSHSEIRRFRAGLDYTVAHYGNMTEIPKLDATLCFVNDHPKLSEISAKQEMRNTRIAKRMAERQANAESEEDDDGNFDGSDSDVDAEDEKVPDWDTGDCGGFECYISADTDEKGDGLDAAEVFKKDEEDDEDSTLLNVNPGFNMLNLVMRDQGLMKFVKYVNSTAPGSRWDVTTEYQLLHEDDEEDEEKDEDSSDSIGEEAESDDK